MTLSDSRRIVIVDYDRGNLFSVLQAFEYLGFRPTISRDSTEIQSATHVVLPGVGAFQDGVNRLKELGLWSPVSAAARSGRPFLGICLGMQMLFERSEEHGMCEGLGVFPGTVRLIPRTSVAGDPVLVPHVGWNRLLAPKSPRAWESSILQDLKNEQSPFVYFVHSYVAFPAEKEVIIGECEYGGRRLCAAVQKANACGVQFHPEKSGPVGLKILEAFARRDVH
jgi:glutamine amidotransferase